ncbi:MAG: hypothetical protein ACXW1P_08180, partial [Methylophilaceae bacterium]
VLELHWTHLIEMAVSPLSIVKHFVHPESGLTCEIAQITHDVADINRSVKGVIDQTYQMIMHTALGSDKPYRVDIYQRYRLRNPIRLLQRTYNKDFFKLYSSHSQSKEGGAVAKGQGIDKRRKPTSLKAVCTCNSSGHCCGHVCL